MKIRTVYNWTFHDGITAVNPGNRFGDIIPPYGWTCWVYPEDDQEFESWMETNCPTADIVHRFNSGNPMWTVYIKDNREASLFALKWI